jgi:predicted enzyme related to lactoylglutathione lyase
MARSGSHYAGTVKLRRLRDEGERHQQDQYSKHGARYHSTAPANYYQETMAEQDKPEIGSVGWIDLTVDNATNVRDFYQAVVGWKAQGVEMSDSGSKYEDFGMAAPSGKSVAGVCHRRGGNKEIPSGWMIYIIVADLEESLRKCVELGGKVLAPTRSYGGQSKYTFIADPSGATCGLFQP